MRKVFALVILILAFVSLTAAAPSSSSEVALQIAAGVIAAITPFIGLAQLHLKDTTIVLVSMALALVIAVIAQLSTGELSTSNLPASALALFEEVLKLWALQQAVFQLFKDHSKIGPLLTTKPLLVAPPPAIP